MRTCRIPVVLCAALVLAACGSSVIVEGSGASGGTGGGGNAGGTSVASTGSAPVPSYPIVVQTKTDGSLRLVIASRGLTCTLPEYLDTSLFACDGFVVEAEFPASSLVAGAVLQDGVDGATISGAESGVPDAPGSENCPAEAGGTWEPPFAITLDDVSAGAITAHITGAQPFFYMGPVNNSYTGVQCEPIPDPLPNPGAGTARAWGADPVTIVVTSEILNCSTQNPSPPIACPSWQLQLTLPASLVQPGKVKLDDPNVDVFYVGTGAPNSSTPGDCPSTGGGLVGDVTIDGVSDSAIQLTLNHIDDGVTSIGVDGVYDAVRCP